MNEGAVFGNRKSGGRATFFDNWKPEKVSEAVY